MKDYQMTIFICNNCGKSFCWEADFNAEQCPNCRSESLITDECTIASVFNIMAHTLDSFTKSGDKNVVSIINDYFKSNNNNNDSEK
jgi:DNA-directed RNA polymerase subunit RPC12/RpoP